ncbi:phytoene desaturase family protein [Gryllotalpicola ginsengisoli]|uniref:phytoene desaturase family protein n=1 Tax=Gryllotalpicola ginsengisoli TaxID=444608 RepID=UPI0003B6915A|nr:NAD(P)/FAD-dependent oxidoreductase [Gryllotalpicola ginsengisoli]
MSDDEAIVVGSGPNGLAAAVTLARAGLRVTVLERADHLGGGVATRELTLPGYRHDVCSAVHPMALVSEFFRRFGLEKRVEMIVPEISYAQPLDERHAAVAYRDLQRTADGLGADAEAWRRLLGPLVEQGDALAETFGDPMIPVPRHIGTAISLGLRTLAQGSPVWNAPFRERDAPALLSGVFAHTIQRMPRLGSAAAGLVLAALAHTAGWPIPRGGSAAIAEALAADLHAHGGRVETGVEVRDLGLLRNAGIVMLDVTPTAFLRIARGRLPERYQRALRRFSYGSGVAKVDFALSEPVPWSAPELREALTVHVGGTREEVAGSEADVAEGRQPGHPYVLVNQPTLADPTRAPDGGHVLWAYTHVPAGSGEDRAEAVLERIEQFAPGFRDTILAVSSRTAQDVERENPNYVGGDIGAGAASAWQLLSRPRPSASPWHTPLPGVYLCSASTVPGPGVHGQCGWHAARLALEQRGVAVPDLAPAEGAA